MIIGIQDELLKINSLGLLERLLQDKTTKTNILWATDVYNEMSTAYQRDKEIQTHLITGSNSGIIKNRARKALEQQTERTRRHAEVFTPLWICRKMNDHADEVWFDRPEVFFNADGKPTSQVEFPKTRRKTPEWQRYVDSRRLEITCGEAPYLVSRYDVSTGEYIEIKNRIGILDRKLRVVNENASDEAEWIKWTIRAYHTTYGYEFQGDNLLIARINLLMTFEEYLRARWNRKPTPKEYQTITNIIAWNIWQMDGLTGTIPYCKAEEEYRQITMFEWFAIEDTNEQTDLKRTQPRCRIYDWLRDRSLCYLDVNTGGRNMKFDFLIGNPPYQDETLGDNKGFAPPIYHLFLDEAYKVSDRVEMIHPARFLFNAGSTPKAWNQKMLDDPHLNVLFYEADGAKVFPGTDIKGGIAITYHDITQDFGAIQTFTAFPELNSIFRKVSKCTSEGDTLDTIINTQLRFDLDVLYDEHPEYSSVLGSGGKDRRFRNNIFDKVSLFTDEPTQDDDIKVIGVVKNKRTWKYISQKYVEMSHANVLKYKVLVPRANGSGALGEVLSTPLIGTPLIGYTQTFIGIGIFETESEANALLKYVKSKFARCMLGILKVTQDNDRGVWKLVPVQDFTLSSDIDWSQSVAGIDQQLYRKYNLSPEEIDFIETHVKEMV